MAAPVELLKRVPLFEGLSDKQLETLAGDFTERTFEEGQELTTEGQGAAGFFILESGEATVTVDGEDRGKLKAGDYFGEIALIDEGRRTATITATKAGLAHGLTVWQFRPLVEANASIAWPLLEAMAKRVRKLEQR
jgi:CRP/FNR family transcriptional regulator, cyclic AMP receptor protein